jgi:hypothetical protein
MMFRQRPPSALLKAGLRPCGVCCQWTADLSGTFDLMAAIEAAIEGRVDPHRKSQKLGENLTYAEEVYDDTGAERCSSAAVRPSRLRCFAVAGPLRLRPFPACQPARVRNEAAGRKPKIPASPDQPDFEGIMRVRQCPVDDPLPAEIGDGRRNQRDTEPA